jgi:PAS domain S-box-containing protein
MSTTEQQILDLARSGQIAMCLIDLLGHIYQANAAFLDLVGATQEDVQTGLSLHEFLNLPQRSPRDEQEPHELQVGQWTATFEQELLRRDGSHLPVLVEFSWLENASDRYVAKIVELVKYQALHAAAIIESSDDAIIGKDLNGIIVSWNKGAERLYGYRGQEVVGQPISLLIPPELSDDLPSILSRLQRGERITQYETVRMKKDGTRVAVSVTISPIRESSGTIIGASSIARDITDRQHMEDLSRKNEELVQRYRRAQEVNRLKSEFLANMSHELRTPLNAIIGFTELIYDEKVGPLSEEQKEYLGDTLSSAQHLLRLITDVLDLAKIEAGEMTFLPEPVDLNELVGEVRNILRPLTADKRLYMEMEIDDRLGEVTVDPAKLKQVLYNYLSNAIKFTPEEGQVTIRLRGEGEDAFRLEVEDTGRGIEPEDLGRLFVEFQQLDAGLTKQYQGTGLGLALTRRIVETQGGRVGVHSIPGQGSTFYAILPRIATVMVEREEEDVAKPMFSVPERPDAPSVLIVEDEPKDRRQLIQAFTEAGYNVEVAATGTQAIAQCRQRSFDVITLDLLLPDLSGWQVLRAIRGEGPNREVPVIVVTLVTEKEVGLGFPIQDVLNKPVTLEQIFSSLERIKKSPDFENDEMHGKQA